MSDPYISRPMVIAAGIVFPVVDMVFVATRFLIKLRRAGGLGVDDYLILSAFVHLCALGGMSVYGATHAGLGETTAPSQSTTESFMVGNDPVYHETTLLIQIYLLLIPTLFGSAKLSVLFFFRTIFRIHRAFDIASWIAISIVTAWIIASIAVTATQCVPMRIGLINVKTLAEECRPGFPIGASTAAFDVATDLMIFALPIYWVLKLHLPLWKKISVVGVFLFGLITIASGIYRLAELGIVYPNHNADPNQYAYLTTLIYFGLIEAGLCTIAACLPTLGPLFTQEGRSRVLHPTRYHQALRDQSIWASKSERTVNTRRGAMITDFLSEDDFHMILDRNKFPHDGALEMNVAAVVDRPLESRNHPEHEGIRITTDVSQESFNAAKLEDQHV